MALENTRLEGIVDFNDNQILKNILPSCKEDNNYRFRQGRTDFELVLQTVNGCNTIELNPEKTEIYVHNKRFKNDAISIPKENFTITGSVIVIIGCEELTFRSGENSIIVKTEKGCSWNLAYSVDVTPAYNGEIVPPEEVKNYAKIDLSNVLDETFLSKGKKVGFLTEENLSAYAKKDEVDDKFIENKKIYSIYDLVDFGYKDSDVAGMDIHEWDIHLIGIIKTMPTDYHSIILTGSVTHGDFPQTTNAFKKFLGVTADTDWTMHMPMGENGAKARVFTLATDTSAPNTYRMICNNYSETERIKLENAHNNQVDTNKLILNGVEYASSRERTFDAYSGTWSMGLGDTRTLDLKGFATGALESITFVVMKANDDVNIRKGVQQYTLTNFVAEKEGELDGFYQKNVITWGGNSEDEDDIIKIYFDLNTHGVLTGYQTENVVDLKSVWVTVTETSWNMMKEEYRDKIETFAKRDRKNLQNMQMVQTETQKGHFTDLKYAEVFLNE